MTKQKKLSSVLTPEMKQMIIEEAVQTCTSFEEVQAFLKEFTWPMLERMLQWEMSHHLGYEKHDVSGNNSGNSRNGISTKKIRTSNGDMNIAVPRDRNGTFEPQIVRKHQSNLSEIEQKIISMYGKWLSTDSIKEHVMEMYWSDISPMAISRITNQILPVVKERQERQLQAVYPMIFLDAIHCKVKENGIYVDKAVYMVVWYDIDWYKDMLWFYVGWSEWSKYWQAVCNDLANRWVRDICIACIDWLSGFAEAIRNVFPKIEIQRCVVHLIRNSCRYVSSADMKAFKSDLAWVYRATTLEVAEKNLAELEKKWGKKYSLAVNSRVNNWWDICWYFKFPKLVRKLVYTTNIIESNNAKIRKVVKKWDVYPTTDALRKKMYLAIQWCTKKRVRPVSHRWQVLWQLQSFFPDTLEKYLL